MQRVFGVTSRWAVVSWIILAAAAWSRCVAAADRPNILWISAEDLSAGTLACYGGAAHTPRLERLAADGLRFDAAFAAAPVCAPSRSAIITGMMPTTLGSLPMRCAATPPPHVVGFPSALRDAGYWCTNNAKTDYNLDRSFQPGWHESGRTAHWRTRPDPTQPFFAVFNLHVTHESMLFGDTPTEATGGLPDAARRSAAVIRVPPYYPDTAGIRRALAQRLELAAVLDIDVGRILDELAADGLTDDTIVFFWGDHGEGIPHGKRSLTEHGLRVPLVIHVPGKFHSKALLPDGRDPRGTTADLVSLLDLGPTVLQLAGVESPGWMEGRPFLGDGSSARQLVIGARDRMDAPPGFGRTARDARFRYVRHFLPWLDGDDLPGYADGVAITGELRAARKAGGLPPGAAWFARTSRPAEELHDLVLDPDEVTDLTADPAHHTDLTRLREAVRGWMRETKDTGILPEPILRREARTVGSEWAIFHPPAEPEIARAAARYDAILDIAWSVADEHDATHFRTRLADPDPAVRYWAVAGTGWAATRGGNDPSAALAPRLADDEPTVRIATAQWLLKAATPPSPDALATLAAETRADDADVRLAALVTIDEVGDAGRTLWRDAAGLTLRKDEEYARRIVERIRRKLAVAPPGSAADSARP
ncbi:MAG: sulfatase-like hydrolase/transferase [Planctomycetia bacterium]|nr:sulfatase-like hydrolase/transferase [Planctomycetia bacterium]